MNYELWIDELMKLDTRFGVRDAGFIWEFEDEGRSNEVILLWGMRDEVMSYELWAMSMGMGIITEFTEMSWNDCVFEHTKEQLRVFWEVHWFFCLCIKK